MTTNTTHDHVICWLNYVEQFIPGKDIAITGMLSRLNSLDKSVLVKGEQVFVLIDSILKGMDFADDPFLIECFLNLPPLPVQDTIQPTINGFYQTK